MAAFTVTLMDDGLCSCEAIANVKHLSYWQALSLIAALTTMLAKHGQVEPEQMLADCLADLSDGSMSLKAMKPQ